ncbi:hypothetical protein WA158_007974 [Blastocystis sp. Blastoise]
MKYKDHTCDGCVFIGSFVCLIVFGNLLSSGIISIQEAWNTPGDSVVDDDQFECCGIAEYNDTILPTEYLGFTCFSETDLNLLMVTCSCCHSLKEESKEDTKNNCSKHKKTKLSKIESPSIYSPPQTTSIYNNIPEATYTNPNIMNNSHGTHNVSQYIDSSYTITSPSPVPPDSHQFLNNTYPSGTIPPSQNSPLLVSPQILSVSQNNINLSNSIHSPSNKLSSSLYVSNTSHATIISSISESPSITVTPIPLSSDNIINTNNIMNTSNKSINIMNTNNNISMSANNNISMNANNNIPITTSIPVIPLPILPPQLYSSTTSNTSDINDNNTIPFYASYSSIESNLPSAPLSNEKDTKVEIPEKLIDTHIQQNSLQENKYIDNTMNIDIDDNDNEDIPKPVLPSNIENPYVSQETGNHCLNNNNNNNSNSSSDDDDDDDDIAKPCIAGDMDYNNNNDNKTIINRLIDKEDNNNTNNINDDDIAKPLYPNISLEDAINDISISTEHNIYTPSATPINTPINTTVTPSMNITTTPIGPPLQTQMTEDASFETQSDDAFSSIHHSMPINTISTLSHNIDIDI